MKPLPQSGEPSQIAEAEDPPEPGAAARNAGLDLLRVLAAVGVVYIHGYSALREGQPEVLHTALGLSVNVATNAAVSAFFLMGGYFFALRLERVGFRQSLKPALWKSGRIYGVYLAWALLFLVAQGHFEPKRLYWRVLSVPVYDWVVGPGPSAHLWFLPVLAVGQLALAAVCGVRNRAPRVALAMLVYAVILAAGPYGEAFPALKLRLDDRYLTGLAFLFTGAALPALAGKPGARRLGLGLSIAGLLLVSVECRHLIESQGRDFLGFPLLGTPLLAVGMFLWLKGIRLRAPRAASAASGLAACGLGIYTMHPLAINALWPAVALLPSDWVQARLHLIVASAFVVSAAVTRLVGATRLSWLVT